MAIRVIAGIAKGRRLKMVPGDTTRPVMDRVKEACFSIIGRRIVNSIFLDLFAGTGSVGIEALSRGAAKAVFVELDPKAIRVIQENLQLVRLENRAIVRRTDVLAFLKTAPPEHYDFIYIAPPQYKGLWLQVLTALDAKRAWIPPGTSVIVQIDPSEKQTIDLKHLAPIDERRYGNTLLWFFAPLEVLSGESGLKD
jgi:16S rRNA (guanine(966)-N(2))-methyltransferase RsmD